MVRISGTVSPVPIRRKNWTALSSGPWEYTELHSLYGKIRTANDSASQSKFVTVRQMFSDDPATKLRRVSKLRRWSLFWSTAAWLYRSVLMSTAPLSSSDSIFLYINSQICVCQHLKVKKKSLCIVEQKAEGEIGWYAKENGYLKNDCVLI